MKSQNKKNILGRSRHALHAFFLLLMTVCMVFASSFVTLAAEQSGNETRINASNLMEEQLLALEKDTVLYMDKDLTLTGISGANFILFIEGSKTLTVDSMGPAINVYALTAEEGSNLTINCRDREEYSIQTKDSFIFRGANLNIDAYYGMKSSMGDIIIDATQSATIRTRKDCAYLVESVGKKYEVQGVEVSILEKAEALKASELQDNADIVLEGDTVLEMDVEKTLHSISGEEYRLVVDGPETLKFDTNSCAIRVQNLTVNTDLTVNSTCGNEYSILVEDNFSFNADNLIVDAVFGIKAKKGTISIDANNHVEVYAKKGACVASEEGSVYIWGQVIWLKNKMEGKDGSALQLEHGVYAGDGVYIFGSGVNNIEVTGIYGIQADDEIKLSGNFTVTAYREAIQAMGFINMEGFFKVTSTFRKEDSGALLDSNAIRAIFSQYGTISMKGSRLIVRGEEGIRTKGSILIDCDEIDIEGTLRDAVAANGDLSLKADKIRITATYERFKADSDIPDAYEIMLKTGYVINGETVTIDSQDAVITGPTPVWAENAVDLNGDIRLNASGYQAGLECWEGPVSLDGDIGIYMDEEDDSAFGIYAGKSITARGTGLYIKAPLGMYTFGGGIDLDCDTISVKTTAGYGMEALKLPVHIKGGNLNIETAFDRKDAFRGGDCIGINAKAGVRLDCASAEILAPVGIQVSDGDVYLNGYSNISVVKKGVYVDTGDIYINGYTHIAMQSGGDYPIRSEKKRIIVNPSLPMIYPNGGNIQAGPGMVLDSEGNIPRYVEFGKEINEISFSMDVPVGLNLMSNKADAVYDLTPGCHVKSVDWYEGEDKDTMNKVVFSNASGVVRHFQAGKKYKATVLIETDDEYLLGYGFRKDDAILKTAVVNGSTSNVGMGYMTNRKEVQVSYDFGTCPTGFYTIDLSVDAPKDGKTPDISIDAAAKGYGVDSENVTWFVSDDGKQYKEMSSGTFFGGGKYYKVSMIVRVPGENFALGWMRDSVTGELEPRTRAFINEKPVDLVPVYKNDDPLHYLRHAEVSYEFGKCNKEVIDLIEVVGVTEPVAGEKPSYVAGVRGTGYHINAYKNNSTYGIRNGVRWFDVTDFDYVYENETFVSGHEYRIDVYLVTDDGYAFYHSNSNGYYEMLFTATVNGNTARGNTSGSSGLYEQTIMCNFICGEPQGSGNNSYSVSGDVTSSGSEIADVTIQLYEEKNPSEPAYETTAVGNDASYMIAGVAPGTYTMKVKKANHVEREYTVTVASQDVEQDAKICLLGDVNMNGNVDYGDLQRLYQHLGTNNKIVDYALLVANVNLDASLNYGDLQRLYQHLSTNNKLF